MISVCMVTYNGEKYLEAQINSILTLLDQTDELVISDDGSTDRTLDILNSYQDPRIKVIHHKKVPQKFLFAYTSSNLENALLHAKGDYLLLSDQDDVWLENKIIKFREAFTKYDIILSDCSYVDSNLEILISSKIEFEHVKIGIWRNMYKSGYLGSSMGFKRWLLKYILPFPPNVPHDLWIGLLGGYIGKFGILPEVTMLYRRHNQNVSATNNKLLDKQKGKSEIPLNRNKNSLLYRLCYRWCVFYGFVKFIIKYHIYR